MPPISRKRATADLVVVANRLPVDRVVGDDGETTWRRSPGGLVSALEPVMRANSGAWIGWPGDTGDVPEPFVDEGLTLVPVALSEREVAEFYEGFSNGTLWPLYHDLVAKPAFHREWWDAYVKVNQRFADAAARFAAKDATVWVQDYQLQLVPAMLRELRPDLRIGFYLHIPFPPAELFSQLPWRRQILEGLLGADLVGFQLTGAAQNFVRLVRQRVGHKTHRDSVYLPDGRVVRAKAFPISIDTEGFEELARSESVSARAKEIRNDLGNPRQVFLGIDRLDYTKGIYARLRAFSELIAEGRLTLEDVVFVQVATPSRERVDQYRILRDEIDRLVGRVNGDLGRIGRPAIS
ncbi:MAG: trehalose 6-phosphate synthase, partial [Marmoricola sp.]|nr:trehalose 6-phosphate synthase [Marmoricola sp.]